VQGRVVRIPLPGDEWIDVKGELNLGERNQMLASMLMFNKESGKKEMDPTLVVGGRMLAYILGWSFTMPNGDPAPVSLSAFDNLDDPTVRDITDALDAHVAAIEREQSDRKNSLDGVNKPGPISPSVR
jgi:hypothetical protein